MATIADRIKEGLRLRDMKQSDLCARTGISRSAMSFYCNGENVPRQKRIYLIARALDVSEAWLMGFDVGDAPRHPLNRLQDKPEEETEREYLAGFVKSGDDGSINIMYRLIRAMQSASYAYSDEDLERLVKVGCNVLSTGRGEFDRVEGVINALLDNRSDTKNEKR